MLLAIYRLIKYSACDNSCSRNTT